MRSGVFVMTGGEDGFRTSTVGAVAGPVVKLGLAILALTLLWNSVSGRLAELDADEIWRFVDATPPGALLAALGFTLISLLAVAAYDVVAFRAIGLSLPVSRALRIGGAATAMGQTFGLGLIVGGFTRWRMARRHGPGAADAAAATAVVAAGFFLGLSVVASAAALIAPESVARATGAVAGEVRLAGGAALALFGGLLLFGRSGGVAVGRFRVTAASPRVLLAQAALAALDVAPAAMALWVLLPAEAAVAPGDLLIAYVAALAVGLISGAPGGIGAFEAVLLLTLPDTPAAPLLAGVLVFRLVYYILPCLVALALLAWEETREEAQTEARAAAPASIEPGLSQSGRAEAALAYLGDKAFLFSADGQAFLMFGARAGALVAMGDPVGPRRCWPELVSGFVALARRRRRAPVFYKIGPAAAALARAYGLDADRLGQEAEVDPFEFSLKDRSRRQLRRKVAQAVKAGLTVEAHAPGAAPLHELTDIDRAWRATKGGREAGFSMGKFAPEYLSRFRIFIARDADGAPAAFLSLWRSGDGCEWSVDLMRAAPGAPQGATQFLITEAIAAARAEGVDRFNLCMAPLSGLDAPATLTERILHEIYRRGEAWHGLQGLHRFKASFDPVWRPRYVAHPCGPSAALAPLAIRGLVRGAPAA